MLFTRKQTYKHSGKLGDIVLSLAFVQSTGGGIFYLTHLNSSIIPLISNQKYIATVAKWDGRSVTYNLDLFRKVGGNLCHRYFRAFGMTSSCNNKWLSFDPNPIQEVVIARSLRARASFPWRRLVAQCKNKAVFIGTKKEHEDFLAITKSNIPYYQTPTLLEAGEVIAGSKIFIGNQSCPFAIAEGMKHTLILENRNHYCVCEREGAFYFNRGKREDELFEFLNTVVPLTKLIN